MKRSNALRLLFVVMQRRSHPSGEPSVGTARVCVAANPSPEVGLPAAP